MDMLKTLMQQFLAEEDGATMIEYGLLAALIAIMVEGALVRLGGSV
jgi:Flp pilus assembly pilin Flp